MSRFVYDKEIPSAILSVLQSNLEPWEWLIPLWCEHVFVGYVADSSEDGASAATRVEYPYRWARITFYPCFLVQNDQSEDALHEIIHIPLAVPGQYMRDQIDVLVPEFEAPKFRETLRRELTERVEAATEDIASRIAAHWPRKRKK